MGVGLREVVAHGGLTLWLAFLKSVAAILGIVKVKQFHTVQPYRKQVFTEIENIPVISYYKFTIDSGKAFTVWFSKSLQYSSGLYTKYISFLYKIPNIHRLCCRNRNKTQDEQDHLDNCYLEH